MQVSILKLKKFSLSLVSQTHLPNLCFLLVFLKFINLPSLKTKKTKEHATDPASPSSSLLPSQPSFPSEGPHSRSPLSSPHSFLSPLPAGACCCRSQKLFSLQSLRISHLAMPKDLSLLDVPAARDGVGHVFLCEKLSHPGLCDASFSVLPSFLLSLPHGLSAFMSRQGCEAWVSGPGKERKGDTTILRYSSSQHRAATTPTSPAFPSFIDSLNKYLSSTNHMPNTVPDPGAAAMKDESVVSLPPVCTGLQFTPLQPIHLLERSDRSCHSLLMKSLQWLALFLSPAPQHGIYLVLIYLSSHSSQRTLQSHRTTHNFPNTHTLSCLFAFPYSASLPPSRTSLLIFFVWQNSLRPSQLSKNVISSMTPCQHPICCSHCTNSLNHLSL